MWRGSARAPARAAWLVWARRGWWTRRWGGERRGAAATGGRWWMRMGVGEWRNPRPRKTLGGREGAGRKGGATHPRAPPSASPPPPPPGQGVAQGLPGQDARWVADGSRRPCHGAGATPPPPQPPAGRGGVPADLLEGGGGGSRDWKRGREGRGLERLRGVGACVDEHHEPERALAVRGGGGVCRRQRGGGCQLFAARPPRRRSVCCPSLGLGGGSAARPTLPHRALPRPTDLRRPPVRVLTATEAQEKARPPSGRAAAPTLFPGS